MTPRLFVRRVAKADVAAGLQWYELHREGLDDVRMALVHRFPFVIYFVILPRHVSVIAVIHGQRNPQVWQQRR